LLGHIKLLCDDDNDDDDYDVYITMPVFRPRIIEVEVSTPLARFVVNLERISFGANGKSCLVVAAAADRNSAN